MDFPLQIQETDWIVSLFFIYAFDFWRLERTTMSKFLTYEDRLVIAQLLQENASFGVIGKKLGKDRTTIAKGNKRHSYDKKVVARDILTIHVNIAVHAKLKSCAETVVRINQHINAAYVPSVHYIVRILQRISAPLKQNLHMYVMVAASFPNVPYSKGFIFKVLCAQIPISDMR